MGFHSKDRKGKDAKRGEKKAGTLSVHSFHPETEQGENLGAQSRLRNHRSSGQYADLRGVREFQKSPRGEEEQGAGGEGGVRKKSKTKLALPSLEQ